MQVTLSNFQYLSSQSRLLHKYLLSILTTNNFQQEHLPQKIMQYIGMIVESQKNPNLNQDFFDYFCQNGGHKIIKLTLEVQPMLSVKVLSMLFINLTSHFWISYLLCQPFINDAIQYEDIPKDQQWPEYYISLLKSLSIRLNQQQLSLFYNKKFCKFPLLFQSLKYYNHPDCMVRTNVMNIILGVMQIKDQRLIKYFGRFPFTSYVLTYCCQVKSRITQLNSHLKQISQINIFASQKQIQDKHKSIIKSYYIDLIDYICYLNDLMELGPVQLSFFVQNSIFTYILLPTLKYLSAQSSPLLISSTFLLYFVLFKTVTNQKFKLLLCLLLTARQLPIYFINKIKQQHIDLIVYTPKIYSQQFQPNKYYWNKFDYQIQKQCVKLFEDVNNFQIQHQSKEQDKDKTNKFLEEIGRISRSLGFNILTYENYEETVPFTQLATLLGFSQVTKQPNLQIKFNLQASQRQLKQNPLRKFLFTFLQSIQKNPSQDYLMLSIYTILNNIIKCQTIDNKFLQYCGLLTPNLDLVNYKEQFNKQSMDKIRSIGLQFIKNINQNSFTKAKQKQSQNQNQDEQKKKDEGLFSLGTIKNFIVLFFDCLYEKLNQEQEKILLFFYRNSILELKQLVLKRNMKTLVQKFELQYGKWSKEAFFYGINLTQNVLTPRKSAKQITSQEQSDNYQNTPIRQYFLNQKQRVLYFIQKFALIQAFYFKYQQHFTEKKHEQIKQQIKDQEETQMNHSHKKKVMKQQQQSQYEIQRKKHISPYQSSKYTTLYLQKYGQIQQTLKLGHSYKIGFKHMISCYSHQKKQKNTKMLIIVQDPHNLIIVQPSTQQNSAKIRINHPWKYVIAEVNRQNAKKMVIRLLQCFRGDNKIELFFDDERRNVSALQWMNGIKYERYMSEQAFILSYLKDCLAKL